MKELALAIEGGVLLGGVWALLAICVGAVVYHCAKAYGIWKRKRSRIALTLIALVSCYVAGTKPPQFNIVWDEGIHDAGSSIDTNDLRHITVSWAYETWIPPRSTLTFSAIPKDSESTNDIFVVASAPITDRSFEAYMERDATNYLFYASHSYIPDVPVVTNGVYHVHCVGGTNVWIPIGLRMEHEGRDISPPHTFTIDITTGEEP